MRKVIYALIFICLSSCSKEIELTTGIWVGYSKETKTYFEMWFSSKELIIYDFNDGLIRMDYLIDDDIISFGDSKLRIDHFAVHKPSTNKLILVGKDSLRYNMVRVCIPYEVDPFKISMSHDSISQDLRDRYDSEMLARRVFFFRYLVRDFYELESRCY